VKTEKYVYVMEIHMLLFTYSNKTYFCKDWKWRCTKEL